MNKVYNFLMKYGGLLALMLSIIILIIFFININTGFSSTEGVDSSTDLAKLIHEKDAPDLNFFNFGLSSAIIMAVIAAIIWVLFGLLGLFLDFKGSLKFLISFAVVIILYFVFYNGAAVESTGRLAELLAAPDDYHVDANISKHITAGIKTTLSLFGLSILTLIGSEILSFFK